MGIRTLFVVLEKCFEWQVDKIDGAFYTMR